MYLGTYEPNLIGKNRLALPKKIRSELQGDRIILTTGFEECIFGFAEKVWEQTIQPEITRPISEEEGRRLRRQMFSDAVTLELDSQGRFVIPENLMKFANIQSGVTVIGAGDHFEIWDNQKWQEYHLGLNKVN